MMQHKVPLLLETEDMFLFNLTLRQCLLLFVSAGMSYAVFLQSFPWLANPTVALIVSLVLALLVFLGMAAIAFVRLGGRGLEEWGLVLLVYTSQPKVFTWHCATLDAFERRSQDEAERDQREEKEHAW